MKQLEDIVQKDPLNLKEFDHSNSQVTAKTMYIFLVLIPVCLLVSLLFYILSSMSGSSSTGSSTSYQVNNDQTTNDTQFVSSFELFSDGKIANSFEKISVGINIMPSQNTEGNMIVMYWTKAATSDDEDLGSKVDVGDYYFFFNDTVNYFPTMHYSTDYVPFGTAQPYCIHLQWSKLEMSRMIDMYKHVQNFPNCENSLNPKYRWQQSDPRFGVDFKPWIQNSEDSTSESDCTSKGGVYWTVINGTNKCYTYDIVERLCLMIAYTEHPETASYAWEYRGGCYGDSNEIAIYQRATLGEDYTFYFVPIEVREDESLYTSITNVENNISSGFSPLLYILSIIFLILAFALAAVFLFFYLKQKFGSQFGGGSSMKHQRQIDVY